MRSLRILSIALGLLAVGGSSALAVNVASCAAVNAVCTSVSATECTISDLRTLTIPAGGTFNCTVDRDLVITGTGSLTVPGDGGVKRTLNLSVAGAVTIEPGGQITGSALGNNAGKAATLNITATGKVTLETNGTGGKITADQTGGSCSSGHAGIIDVTSTYTPVDNTDVSIAVGENALISTNGTICPAGDITLEAPNGRVTIDGTVESAVDAGSTGNGRGEDGGPITIIAGCDLLVTGKVSSRGRDNGADRVHLEGGCSVNVTGLVESKGAGHVSDGENVCKGPQRPDKPDSAAEGGFSNGCVEIWSGSTIDVSGEINADIGTQGGTDGIGWIDLFAVGDITITGDASSFAVHANGGLNQNTDNGGIVTVKSRDGKVTASQNAIQASALTCNGGKGGRVTVQGKQDVNLTPGAVIQARGCVPAGGAGGDVRIRSFGVAPSTGSIVSDAASVIDVTGGTPANGIIALEACSTIGFPPGTTTPVSVVVGKTFTCGGNPSFESYVVFPTCQCLEEPDFGFCLKAPVRSVLDPDTGRFPGNEGPDLLVRFDLDESVQDGLDSVSDTNDDGYIILAVAKDDTGQLGGHRVESIAIERAYEQRFALIGCSVTLHDEDLGDGRPTATVASTASSPVGSLENIFVMDIHGADSEVAGWKIEGDGRYFRNVYGLDSATGLWFSGNGNTMHNGKAEDNSGVGILVQGNGNLVDSADSNGNDGHGIQVVGAGNTIDGTDVGDRGKGNGGDGINVAGAGNRILENDVFANLGNGIFVAGDSSTIKKNDVGERGKENGLDGIHLEGSNSVLQENNAKANGGDGFDVLGSGNLFKKNTAGDSGDNRNGGDGFHVFGNSNVFDENKASANLGDGFELSGTGDTLKNTRSNDGSSNGSRENGGKEYVFANPVKDLGGNKKDNVNFVGVGSPKFYAAGSYE